MNGTQTSMRHMINNCPRNMRQGILSIQNALVCVLDVFNLFTPGLFNRQAVYWLCQIKQNYIDPPLWTPTKSPEAEVIKTLLPNKSDNDLIILFSSCTLWSEFPPTNIRDWISNKERRSCLSGSLCSIFVGMQVSYSRKEFPTGFSPFILFHKDIAQVLPIIFGQQWLSFCNNSFIPSNVYCHMP